MDLENWEFLSGNGIHGSGQEPCFNPTGFFDVNYFPSPSPAMQEGPIPRSDDRLQVLAPIDADPIVEKSRDEVIVKEIVDDCSVPPVTVEEKEVQFEIVFEELKENKSWDEKVESPKSDTGVAIMPQLGEGFLQFADENSEPYMAKHLEQEMPEHASFKDGSSFRWRTTGLRALCSMGMAAATLLVLVLGGNHQQKQPKLQYQIKDNDKRIDQVMQQATETGTEMTTARILFGGKYNGLSLDRAT